HVAVLVELDRSGHAVELRVLESGDDLRTRVLRQRRLALQHRLQRGDDRVRGVVRVRAEVARRVGEPGGLVRGEELRRTGDLVDRLTDATRVRAIRGGARPGDVRGIVHAVAAHLRRREA